MATAKLPPDIRTQGGVGAERRAVGSGSEGKVGVYNVLDVGVETADLAVSSASQAVFFAQAQVLVRVHGFEDKTGPQKLGIGNKVGA
jgi:hypothetical protein